MKLLVLINMNRGISEHLILVALRSNAHILLSKRFDMRVDVGVFLEAVLAPTHRR